MIKPIYSYYSFYIYGVNLVIIDDICGECLIFLRTVVIEYIQNILIKF